MDLLKKLANASRPLCFAVVLVLCMPVPIVQATTNVADIVVNQLVDQGFAVTSVRRTLLGRILIKAEREGAVREVVLNRTTGEVLRDLTRNSKTNAVIPFGEAVKGQLPPAPRSGLGTQTPKRLDPGRTNPPSSRPQEPQGARQPRSNRGSDARESRR